MLHYTDGAKKTAQEKGLHLVKIEINGRYAKKMSMQMAGPVGPKTVDKLMEFMLILADKNKRME